MFRVVAYFIGKQDIAEQALCAMDGAVEPSWMSLWRACVQCPAMQHN
jgi:hypothetical protein